MQSLALCQTLGMILRCLFAGISYNPELTGIPSGMNKSQSGEQKQRRKGGVQVEQLHQRMCK